MDDTYYTSDPHLFHPLVSRLRGFDSPADHNAAFMDNFGSLRRRDTLVIVGDLAVGRYQDALDLVAKLGCTLRLVEGNHDLSFPGMRGHHSKQRAALEVFETVMLHDQIRTAIGPIMISHFPYTGDHGPDRYTQWRLRDQGIPIIHGHTHGTEKVTLSANGTIQVHVGVDAWGMQPVPLSVILEMITTERAWMP